MPSNLTPKQEKFCQVYIETGNASEAYRQAYDVKKMKSETVTVKASELLKNGNITVRVEQLKNHHAKRHNYKVDDLLEELEQARQLALQAEQTSAAVSATMGKAKLLGLDKQVIEHSGTVGSIDLTKAVTEEQMERMAKEVMLKQGYEFDE